ncbi:MAG: hypothetical protein HUJ68_12185 [Clostridia bacterium]|nr:hypothetical protein [Clostridia bacterium]
MTDNEQYYELQENFFASKNKIDKDKYITAMYSMIKDYNTKFLKKYYRRRRIIYSEEELNDNVEDMSLWIIRMYYTRPDWKGIKSPKEGGGMTAYSHNAFLKIIYNPQKIFEDKLKNEIKKLNMNETYLDFFKNEIKSENGIIYEKVKDNIYQGLLPLGW